MAIITAVLLVGIAIFILGHSEGDVVEYEVDDSRAFYIAEGGLERVRSYLTALEESDPSADPVGTTFNGQTLGGGVYDVVVVADANPSGTADAYEVISTGTKDGAVRQVKATVIGETFAIYQWFIGSVGGGFSWFRTGERFEGPVHVNGTIDIDGDPWFGGVVRAGGNHINMTQGSNPTFERGYELNVEHIDMPSTNETVATLRAQADDGGWRWGKLGPNGAYWNVVLQGDYATADAFDKFGNPIGGVPGQIIPFAGINGAVWFDDDIRIEGVLDGEVTIGVDGNVIITNDILYADSSPGSGPNEGCDDVLGIIAAGQSQGNVIIEDNAANGDNCEIHGVFMALNNTIEAEDYQHGSPRGNLTLYGGLLAQSAIHLAEYNNNGVITSGYYRDYHYDGRMLFLPPPFFPFASNFAIWIWEEVVPVQVVGG
jgi:hypothetical protein